MKDKAISSIDNNILLLKLTHRLTVPTSRNRTHNEYLKNRAKELKEETEGIEPIVTLTKQGKTKQIPLGINSATHKKIIISLETCKQLTEYARSGRYYENEVSFDSAIQSLLKFYYTEMNRRNSLESDNEYSNPSV